MRIELGPNGLFLAGIDDGEPLCSTSTEPVEIASVSVSQLNEYNRCPRRWFLRKVRKVRVYDADGKPTTEHKKQANTGNEIHQDHDRYYRTGTIVKGSKHERRLRASLEHLPPCGPLVSSEERFDLPVTTESGQCLKFTGVIDLVDKRSLPEVLLITDHKTTGSIEKRREEPVDVANDAQMLTYAHVGYETYKPGCVKVAHNTISTKHVARTLPPVYVDISRQKAQQNWVDQTATIGTMIKLAENPPADWSDVQYNAEACSDFGGCDFLPLCAVRTPTLGVPPMAHDQDAASDLLKRLAALNGAITVAPVAEQAPVPAMVLPGEIAKHDPGDGTHGMKALPGDGTHGFKAPAVMEAPAELLETGEIALRPENRADVEIQLLPPDAPSRMTPVEAAEEAPKAKKGRPKKTAEATGELIKTSSTMVQDVAAELFRLMRTVQYEFDVDKIMESADNLPVYLETRQSDGWELIPGFFDGIYTVWRRVKV